MFEQGEDVNLEPAAPPPEQSNRTFAIVAGIMAGVVLISIILMAAYALLYLPRQKAAQSGMAATIMAQNAAINQAMTMTMLANQLATQVQAAQATSTLFPSPTLPASPTPVLAQASSTPGIEAAMTATWSAMSTQIARGIRTPTATASSSMPRSGFADEVGLPGLLATSLILVVVILLARRLRATPQR